MRQQCLGEAIVAALQLPLQGTHQLAHVFEPPALAFVKPVAQFAALQLRCLLLLHHFDQLFREMHTLLVLGQPTSHSHRNLVGEVEQDRMRPRPDRPDLLVQCFALLLEVSADLLFPLRRPMLLQKTG